MGTRGSKRVVITGLGPISSIGTGKSAFWEALLRGASGTKRLQFPWADRPEFHTRLGAPVSPIDATDYDVSESEARLLDPVSQFSLIGAHLALHDAGFSLSLSDERRNRLMINEVDSERAGVILGTGVGGLRSIETSHERWVHKIPLTGPLRFSLPMLIPNAVPAQVAIKFGMRGECKAIATACAAGTMAVGDAFRLVRDNELDIAVTGGVEKLLSDTGSPLGGFGLIGFDLLKTLSTRSDDPAAASRPFDRDRDGFVLSEGAGVLVLENLDHAKARGAQIYAEVVGYASTCDAFSMVQLEPTGTQMSRVMNSALRSAGTPPEEVVYVNAHGTSTRPNDKQESLALHEVFSKHVKNVLVNSTKAMTGHGIAASGGLEAITTALSLAKGLVHRCVNLDNQDPDCDLELPRENCRLDAGVALSNSYGFGGHNASLVLRSV